LAHQCFTCGSGFEYVPFGDATMITCARCVQAAGWEARHRVVDSAYAADLERFVRVVTGRASALHERSHSVSQS
jgi:hypothetical protein